MNEKLDRLRKQLTAHAPLVVAYSGGMDSACLLAEGRQALDSQVLG
jgi:PP-loop superfamily ATP-utilizing enzyme